MQALPTPQDVIAAGVDARLSERRDTGKAFMSEAAKGVRERVFQMRHGREEPDARTRAVFVRGLDIEDWFLDEYEKKLGYKLERQHLVPSPYPDILGKGHVDGFAKKVKTGLEVKSVANLANADVPYLGHLMQCATYVNFDDVMDLMLLIYIDPASLETKQFPVQANDAMKQQLLADLDCINRHIKQDTDPLFCGDDPSKEPCTTYYGRRESPCQFHDRCWRGYIAPGTPSVNGDYTDDMKRLQQIKMETSRVNSLTSELKAERDDIRGRLAPVLIEAGGEVAADSVVVKRTESTSEKFNFKAADKAGMVDRDLLGDFIEETTTTRWNVKEVKNG